MRPPLVLEKLPEDAPLDDAIVLDTITHNYGSCEMNAAQLKALQEWAKSK